MSSNNFTKYLFENFSFLICTPLCSYLYNFIIDIWSNNEFKFMDYFSFEQKKLMMHIIYEKDSQKYVDNMMSNDKKDKVIIDFIDAIRRDVKYPDELPKKVNKFNDKLFKIIYNNVICNDIKNELDILENDIQTVEEMLNNSNISNELNDVFNAYYDIILHDMVYLEKYIDSQKVIFIKNYLDLIYDANQDNLSNNEISYVINKKVFEFNKNVKDDKDSIKNKCTFFSSILEKWLNIYKDGEKLYKINLYPNNNSFEKINIYQDICNIGEVDLIRLISPLVNKMSSKDKKNILNKMSSGTKKKCEKFFISQLDIEKKLFDITKDTKFMKSISTRPKNTKDFKQKIDKFVDKINDTLCDLNI
jgi:hypothetical protein